MNKKKIVVKHIEEFAKHRDFTDGSINIIAFGPEEMDAHDGYHTFSELYEHRFALFIALCKKINDVDQSEMEIQKFKDGFAFDGTKFVRKVWRSQLHSDGTDYPGWFILGIYKESGKQITYHLPNAKWDLVSFAETLEKAPEWDKHTPEDVLERLIKLL